MEDLKTSIAQYLSHCQFQKNLNEKTIKAYKIDLNQYLATTSGNPTVCKASITKYIELLHNQYKPKTVKRKIASLRAFANYLDNEELLQTNPFQKMHIKYKEASILPRTIPPLLIQKILNSLYIRHQRQSLPFSTAESSRDIAVIELLFATGLRISELCSLDLDSINIKARYVRVLGKGSKERIVQVENMDVLSALKSYLSFRSILSHPHEEVAFFINRCGKRLSSQSVRFLIDHCAKQVNAKIHVTPHMFRHTFATMLLEEGVDIRYIQNILGHSSILTTQIYTRVSSKKQKSILRHKHPRNRLNISVTTT